MAAFTPFAEADPLYELAGTERLRLADGVLLTAEHFRTEQIYHRARLSRLLAYLTGPGTVAGLDVAWEEVSGEDGSYTELQVTPGLGVDYRGRLLELGYKACLNVADWVEDLSGADAARLAQASRPAGNGLPAHAVADLFADFRNFARRPEPAFSTGNADKIDGTEATLSDESVYLHLVLRDADDDRLPESMISRLVDDPPTAEKIQAAKRQSLWSALSPRGESLALDAELPETEHDLTQQDFGGVFLARLSLPLRTVDQELRFDTTFDMSAASVAPDFSGRLYSYSAAELALLSGLRR